MPATCPGPLLVVLNDNDMSISPAGGALSTYLKPHALSPRCSSAPAALRRR